ncbi:hypothetical protein AB0I53_14165 [Saccharopolyspora sp. NPDC050389]|uniref:hypothetical protein n=1 Tax=Saccharopolyspora sp. NPDC050389 TaxID=3155516 RepID=UPI0033EF020C
MNEAGADLVQDQHPLYPHLRVSPPAECSANFEGDEDPAYRALVNDFYQAWTTWNDNQDTPEAEQLKAPKEQLADQLRAIRHPPMPPNLLFEP